MTVTVSPAPDLPAYLSAELLDGSRKKIERLPASGHLDDAGRRYLEVEAGTSAVGPTYRLYAAVEDATGLRRAGASRELAEFLGPPQLVPAYEAVLALATAANALHRLTRNEPDQADSRPKPVVLASRFAQVFGRLDAGQLALLRHACLFMVENLLASGQRGRPAGLTIRSDDDGRRYAADLRDGHATVVSAELTPCFETGVTLVQAMPMVGEALHGFRTAPARPPAARYLWLFEGLEVAQLEATRDACWQLLQP